MASSSNVAGRHPCGHTVMEHLLHDPLCENQDCAKKAMNIAINALTLGVASYTYSWWYSEGYRLKKLREDNTVKAIQNVQNHAADEGIASYSSEGQGAIDFAVQMLRDTPQIQWPIYIGYPRMQPVNQAIGLLMSIQSVCYMRLLTAIKNHPLNPWDTFDVQFAADKAMKASFAVSSLVLDDLPAFVKQLALSKGESRTHAQALTNQDSYFFIAFFLCTRMYHKIRGGYVFSRLPGRADEVYDLIFPGKPWPRRENFSTNQEFEWAYNARLYELDVVADHISEPFYKENALQSSWRRLYNEFCARARTYVQESELTVLDARFVHWIQSDTDPGTFSHDPGECPT